MFNGWGQTNNNNSIKMCVWNFPKQSSFKEKMVCSVRVFNDLIQISVDVFSSSSVLFGILLIRYVHEMRLNAVGNDSVQCIATRIRP